MNINVLSTHSIMWWKIIFISLLLL